MSLREYKFQPRTTNNSNSYASYPRLNQYNQSIPTYDSNRNGYQPNRTASNRTSYMKQSNQEYSDRKAYEENSKEIQLNSVIRGELYQLETQPILHSYAPQTYNIDLSNFPSLNRTVEYMLCATGYNQLACLLGVLGVISVIANRTYKIDIDANWSETLALHILISAPSGSRKTQFVNMLTEPVNSFLEKQAENAYIEEFVRTTSKCDNNLSHKECTQSALQEAKGRSPEEKLAIFVKSAEAIKAKKIPIQKDFKPFLNSFTPKGLLMSLQEQGGCGCITDESDFLDAAIFDSNANLNLFAKAYDGSSYTERSRKGNIELKTPTLSSINVIQDNIAAKIYTNQKLIDKGCAARITPFFCSKDYNPKQPKAVDSNNLLFIDKVTSLLEQAKKHSSDKKLTIGVEPAAHKLALQFREEILRYMNDYTSFSVTPTSHAQLRKLHGLAVRLAATIHIWNNDYPNETKINVREMEVAISLCRALLPHIEWAYNPTMLPAKADAIKILNNLKNINIALGYDTLAKHHIDSRTIQQRTDLTAERVKNALSYLERYNIVRVLDAGRRSDIAVLHPHYMTAQID